MEILRNNELIGYNYYFFSQKNNITLVTNQFKFEVKLLGATVFKVEGIGEEKYQKDQLISFKSKTLQNKKAPSISAEDGLASLAIAIAAKRSLKENKPVNIS